MPVSFQTFSFNSDGRLRNNAPSDLDSEAAQQVDEKFKQILRKKKGGYLNNLRASYPQSDAETIRTEDFEKRFQNAMVYNSGASPRSKSTEPRSPQRRRLPRHLQASDAESVKTEDFEIRFRDLIVRPLEPGADTRTDSEISDPLHQKVKEILRLTAPYDENGKIKQMTTAADDNRNNSHKRRQNSDRWNHRNRTGNDVQMDQGLRRPSSAMSNSFDEESSIATSSDLMNWSLTSKSALNKRMSSSSVGTSSISSGYNQNSDRQSPDRPFSESRTASWSSLFLGENSEFSANQSPVSSPQYLSRNPLLEHVYDDTGRVNLMLDRDGYWNIQKSPLTRDENENKDTKQQRRELILPEEDDDEYPFAKYRFNKKPDKDFSSSPSEISCSSRDSSSGGGSLSIDYSRRFVQRGPIKQQESNLSTWTSSLTSALSDDFPSLDTLPTSMDNSRNPSTVKGSYPNVENSNMSYGMPNMYGSPYLNMMPPPNFYPYQSVQSSQDQLLMGLGFGGGYDNLLPDRFAQDWYSKIHRARFEFMRRQQFERQMEYSFPDFSEYEPSSIQSSGRNTPLWRHSVNDYPKSKGKTSQRNGSRVSVYSSGPSPNLSFDTHGGMSPKVGNDRQNSINKLRELLKVKQTDFQNSRNEVRDVRRKQFATCRQKSLPTYLETLTEEDDDNRAIRQYLQGRKRLSRVSEAFSKEKGSDTSSLDLGKSESGGSSRSLSKDDGVEEKSPLKPISKMKSEIFVSIPSITINESGSDSRTVSSNDSLEIADILRESKKDVTVNGNGEKVFDNHVDRAVLSVITNDSERTKSEKTVKENTLSVIRPQYLTVDLTDDRLQPPATPSSASSVSPCPLSPITVIEVNLDNQNDSLDTDDSHAASRKSSMDSEAAETVGLFQSLYKGDVHVAMLETIKETNSNKSSIEIHDTGIDIENETKNEITGTCTFDVSVQADDGSLSPIIRLSDLDQILKKLILEENELFYAVHDRGTQSEPVLYKTNGEDENELSNFAAADRSYISYTHTPSQTYKDGTCDMQEKDTQTNESLSESVDVMTQTRYDPHRLTTTCGNCSKMLRVYSSSQSSFEVGDRNSTTVDRSPGIVHGRHLGRLLNGTSEESADSNFSRIFSSSICDDGDDDGEVFNDAFNSVNRNRRHRMKQTISTSSEDDVQVRRIQSAPRLTNGFDYFTGGNNMQHNSHGITINVRRDSDS
ncbi:hypothetical protein FSP39_021378 [Pinctada imbricata]|uniref:Uncharacterized protein n=1 Tax=Pinctada imbricata TaxID=66713 RepID=A0AA88XG66_PINIB|nr:hypothetical protein FSP39_021378 [Pinctada imbricata]